MPVFARHLRALPATCLLLIAAACAQTSASAPTEAPPTAEEVLSRSRAAVATAESFRFSGEWVFNAGQSSQRWTRSGEWAAPDRYRLRFEGVDQTAGNGQELVVIGNEGYFRPTGRDRWVELDVSPAIRSDASGMAIPELDGTRFLDQSWPDEHGLFHVTGTIRASPPGGPVADGSPGASATTYLLAIRASDYLPEELVIETPGARFDPASGKVQVDMTQVQRLVVRFHDFGSPVRIEVPSPVDKADDDTGRVSSAGPPGS